jgi:hypothetical protein
LTLRQLYYQFGRDKSLPKIRNMAGWAEPLSMRAVPIDWAQIEDRTRDLSSWSHWSSPAEIISSSAASYCEDLCVVTRSYKAQPLPLGAFAVSQILGVKVGRELAHDVPQRVRLGRMVFEPACEALSQLRDGTCGST